MNEVQKTYPTPMKEDGFFYESETDEALKIETKVVGDDTFKRVQLSKGRYAELKEITGADCERAKVMCGRDQTKLEAAYASISATLYGSDGAKIPFVMEDMGSWKAKDYNALTTASAQINF